MEAVVNISRDFDVEMLNLRAMDLMAGSRQIAALLGSHERPSEDPVRLQDIVRIPAFED